MTSADMPSADPADPEGASTDRVVAQIVSATRRRSELADFHRARSEYSNAARRVTNHLRCLEAAASDQEIHS